MKKITTFFLFVLMVMCFSCDKDFTTKSDVATNDNVTQTEETTEAKEPTSTEIGEAYGVILALSVQNSELDLDIEALKKSYKESMKKELSSTDEQLAITVLNSAFKVAFERKKVRIKKEGEDFLAKNGNRPEVVTLESGVQYEVLEEGSGETPESDSTCKLHYVGTFIDGEEFENSRNYDDGNPVDVNLTMVIPGWQEGVSHMKVGGKYKIFIPYQLAYGEKGVHAPNGKELIPPCATIIFEIELVSVEPIEKADSIN